MDPTGTIGGWKTAIFCDGQGRPYWRSDGFPLDAPNFEDMTVPEEEKRAWLKAHPEVKIERKAFEKWILKTRKQTNPWGLTELNHAGDGYLDLYTQKQWEGWQAGFAAGHRDATLAILRVFM